MFKLELGITDHEIEDEVVFSLAPDVGQNSAQTRTLCRRIVVIQGRGRNQQEAGVRHRGRATQTKRTLKLEKNVSLNLSIFPPFQSFKKI